MGLVKNKDAKNALYIASMCSMSYLAVYFAKNILSATTPQLIENGVATQSDIGTFSSVYFVCYAMGQLVNGMIGDKIKAKYMISFGLILAGISNFLFINLISSMLFASVAYALMGVALSMIFGPMTKTVAENTSPLYAPRCSLGYTVSSFLGSPFAGVAAAAFAWKFVFYLNTVALLIMGAICFVVFLIFEKKGIVKYNQFDIKKQKGEKIGLKESVKILVKRQIIKFTIIAVVTGVVRTAVVFWLPTYVNQYLGFSAESSATVFTVATFIFSASAIIAVFTYEQLKRNMDLTILLMFSVSSVMFLLVYLVKIPAVNIVLLILAVLSSNCAASMLWSRYCAGLRDTGLVSAATGFLDSMSYLAAAIASNVFANAVNGIGWGNLILVWLGLVVIGVIVSLPYEKIRKH